MKYIEVPEGLTASATFAARGPHVLLFESDEEWARQAGWTPALPVRAATEYGGRRGIEYGVAVRWAMQFVVASEDVKQVNAVGAFISAEAITRMLNTIQELGGKAPLAAVSPGAMGSTTGPSTK